MSSSLFGCAAFFVTIVKDRFNRFAEQARDFEGERQGRVIAPSLNRIHALPGDVEMFAQNGLRPAPLTAQCLQAIMHNPSAELDQKP